MKKITDRLKAAIAVAMFFVAANANAVPACPDCNGNGVVDSNDAAVLFAQFGMSSADAAFNAAVDMNGNGVIDSNDAAVMFSTFGQTMDSTPVDTTDTTGGATNLSEPATLWMFVLGLAFAVVFRRRAQAA